MKSECVVLFAPVGNAWTFALKIPGRPIVFGEAPTLRAAFDTARRRAYRDLPHAGDEREHFEVSIGPAPTVPELVEGATDGTPSV